MRKQMASMILATLLTFAGLVPAQAKSTTSLFRPKVLKCRPGAYKTSTVTDQCYETAEGIYCCNGLGSETSKCSEDGEWVLNNATCAAEGGFTEMGTGTGEPRDRLE